MIRVFVLALAAANVLFLGWSRWINAEQPRLVAPAVTAGTPAAPAPTPSVCTTIGPVADETRALELEQLLRDQQFTALRRSAEESVHEGWWVYVAAADAAAQARTLRRIQASGIRDAFAMPDDPQFRVSVGIFREQEGASNRAAVVRALRLEAAVEERVQQHTVTWFDLAGTAADKVDMTRLGREGVSVQALRLEACPADAAIPIGAQTDRAAESPPAGTGSAQAR